MRRALTYLARDLVFLAVLCLVCGSALAGMVAIHPLLLGAVPGPWRYLAFPLYVPLFALAMCPALLLTRLAAGPLVPGRYPLRGGGRRVRAWMVHFGLARIAHNPLWHRFIFGLPTLRWVVLRALGCRAALAFESSSDVVVLDAALHRIDAGAMLAAQVKLAGHVVRDGQLLLASVQVGRDAQVLVGVRLGPGTEVGDGVVIGPLSQLAGRTRIAARALVGAAVHIADGGEIGEGARIGEDARLGLRARIGAGATVAAGTHLGNGVTVADAAHIGEAARLGSRVHVGAGARVGRLAVLGAGVTVGAGALIGAGAWLSDGVSIDPGARIADGARIDGPGAAQPPVAEPEAPA